MNRFKLFLARWLFREGTIQYIPELHAIQTQVDALAFFAADTCEVVNPLIAQVDRLEHGDKAAKTVPRRLRVKHK